MLTSRWRAGLVLACATGLVSLAAIPPGPARAAVRAPGAGLTRSAVADGISDKQQWVLGMLDVGAAWSVTRGAGVTVAVIDSGVNPAVSDLSGSVITGPDYTGVTTSPANGDWGVHGTWMASLIAGHGHDNGLDGVTGIAPQARILSIRVIPDRGDPHYRKYEREQETVIQQSLADGIRYAVAHGAKVISMSIGYSSQSGNGPGRAAAGLRPRRGRDRLRRELRRPVGFWPVRRCARVLPRGLPGRDQRRRGLPQRQGGRVLQR